MPASSYSYSVPVFLSGLQTLQTLLTKAANHAAGTNTPLSKLISGCIHPDKKSLSHQIRGAARIPRNAIAYLTSTKPIEMEDPSDSFEHLQKHIAETIKILEQAGGPSAFTKDDTDEITFQWEHAPQTTSVVKYISGYALPDFFFHVSNAFTILKIQGVPLSKTDYLRSFVA